MLIALLGRGKLIFSTILTGAIYHRMLYIRTYEPVLDKNCKKESCSDLLEAVFTGLLLMFPGDSSEQIRTRSKIYTSSLWFVFLSLHSIKQGRKTSSFFSFGKEIQVLGNPWGTKWKRVSQSKETSPTFTCEITVVTPEYQMHNTVFSASEMTHLENITARF